MTRAVCIDGSVMAPEEARVSVLDRGFLYGDGAFESLRTYDGVPFDLERHLERLRTGLALLQIPFPETIADDVGLALGASCASAGAERYVRIMVTRGVTARGLTLATDVVPTRVVLVEAFSAPPRALYDAGLRAIGVPAEAPPAGGGAKLLPYVTNALLLAEATRRGADDALLVDGRGQVREATTANVFAVHGRTLSTPPARLDGGGGVLPGITRRRVLDLARVRGFDVREAPLSIEALAAADEAFLTSSLREVVPLVAIDQHRIGTGAPGEQTRGIHRAYREAAGQREVPWTHARTPP